MENLQKSFLLISSLILLLTPSCNREDPLPCYECITTHILTANPSLPQYPDTTKVIKEICNQTQDQIKTHELLNQGSFSLIVPSDIYPSGILVQDIYSTKCSPK